jgi:nucleotide-binding universal stress UspA family protein
MQLQVRNILYATDLGKTSSYAFRYAAYLARLTGAELHLLHVVTELSEEAHFAIQTYVMDTAQRHEILSKRTEAAKARLEKAQEAFWADQSEEDRKVRGQIKSVTVCESFPAEEILKQSKAHACDLIVMGAHEKGFAHTFLGSIAKSVLRRSRVPTMIVPLPGDD